VTFINYILKDEDLVSNKGLRLRGLNKHIVPELGKIILKRSSEKAIS